jgi:hypothetical protein
MIRKLDTDRSIIIWPPGPGFKDHGSAAVDSILTEVPVPGNDWIKIEKGCACFGPIPVDPPALAAAHPVFSAQHLKNQDSFKNQERKSVNRADPYRSPRVSWTRIRIAMKFTEMYFFSINFIYLFRFFLSIFFDQSYFGNRFYSFFFEVYSFSIKTKEKEEI